MTKQQAFALFLLFVVVCEIIFTVTLVSAEQVNAPTQQYNKIFLNPFYRQSMSQNTNYTYTMTINPPDKVSSILSAIVSFDIYITPTVTFWLWVDGQPCNTPNYTISTTYSGAGQSRVTFDCSNRITQAGTYTLTLRPTQANTGATTGYADITYMNNPSGSLTVHGTEYTFGQDAKVWLQLTDANHSAVNNGVCFVDVYTPNGTELVEHATMNNLNHDGIYYYDLTAPSIEGVYPAIARCYYVATQLFNYATSYILVNATLTAGTISDTYTDNAVSLKTKEINVGGIRKIITDFTFDMTSCRNISEQLLTGISIYADAKFDSVVNDDITIYILNQSSGNYNPLPNKILEGNVFRQVSNSLSFNNITTAGYVNSSSTLRLRFVDTNLTDGGADDLEIDYLYVACDQLSSPNWETLSGSSELHISQPINITIVAEEIWNYNGTINSNIISQFVNAIWNYTSTITNSILGQISTYIWENSTSRNLTYYPPMNVTTQIVNITFDYNAIGEGVWNYTGNRTLNPTITIDYNQISNSVWNATNRSLTLYLTSNLTANDIWSHYNRTLTFYPSQSDLTNYSQIAMTVWNFADGRNLTFYAPAIEINYSMIQEMTWNYTQGKYVNGITP